jgi:AraC-like DNA-binding protein
MVHDPDIAPIPGCLFGQARGMLQLFEQACTQRGLASECLSSDCQMGCFVEWLLLPLQLQQSALEQFAVVHDSMAAFSLRYWEGVIPASAPQPLKRLFLCNVEALLAERRYRTLGRETRSDSRLTDLLSELQGQGGKIALSIKALAVRCSVSPGRLGRVFKELTGTPFRRYLRCLRVVRAAQLLLSSCQIKDIWPALGYSDGSNFGRDFRRELGISPGALRGSVLRTRSDSV